MKKIILIIVMLFFLFTTTFSLALKPLSEDVMSNIHVNTGVTMIQNNNGGHGLVKIAQNKKVKNNNAGSTGNHQIKYKHKSHDLSHLKKSRDLTNEYHYNVKHNIHHVRRSIIKGVHK